MDFVKNSPDRYARPPSTNERIALTAGGGHHNRILLNFTNAILDGEALIAPASEGLLSVELSNAMIYSGLTKQTVELPLDASLYATELERLVKSSRYVKPPVQHGSTGDMARSFR
jgi:hypothetical protein